MADSDSSCVSASADDKARGASWRDHLKVHPAADLFPLMSASELRELGENIKKHGGLISPITFVQVGDHFELLDGRNRLDAMDLVGMCIDFKRWAEEGGDIIRPIPDGVDPYDFVLTANLHRRHLTDEQRRELIAKVIKAKPEASDRAIAKQVKRDHKTVAKVRQKLESTGELSPVETRIGADGKQRKSRAPRPKVVAPSPKLVEHRVTESAEVSIEERRAQNAALDEPETVIDEVDKRVNCVTNTILRHIEGLSHSDAERFIAALRDRLADIAVEAVRAAATSKAAE